MHTIERTAAAPSPVPPAAEAPAPCLVNPSRKGMLATLGSAISDLIGSAAGYDERILAKYGSHTDEKRRWNIGRAIVVATAVGSLGWLTKILMSFPGWVAIPVALTIASLYAVLSFSLESFFAANVNPYASVWSKLGSLTGRSMLSVVIAFAGALPWITISLKPSIQVEMTKLALAEHAALRGNVDAAYGVAAIDKKAAALQAEAQGWSAALATLPPALQSAIDLAQSCAVEFDRMKEAGAARTTSLNARLSMLARLEGAQNATSATIKAVAVERTQIRGTLARIGQEIATKKAGCDEMRASSEAARVAHVNFATEEQSNSAKRLALLRKDESEVTAKVQVERAHVDQLVEKNSLGNSAAEFSALLSVVKTQLFAQFLAGLIFLGLFLVDVLPLTLRLFVRPGPYDSEKRTDDEIRTMRAEGRYLEAKMMHEARRAEMESKELQALVRVECRPQIRSSTLNGVNAFLRKRSGGDLSAT